MISESWIAWCHSKWSLFHLDRWSINIDHESTFEVFSFPIICTWLEFGYVRMDITTCYKCWTIIVIEINTDDEILLDGKETFSCLSSTSLTKFRYFLQFDNWPSVDQINILHSWQQVNILIVDTIALNIFNLNLQYWLAIMSSFAAHYSSQVRSLTVYDISTRLA